MLKEERHQLILNEVALHNRVLLADIAEVLNVSVDTVRRDVIQLDTEKKLKKVHGGAVSLAYANNTGEQTKVYAIEKKRIIAKKAVQLLRNGNIIIIHGGTTCLEFARNIPEKMSLTCFTLSLPIAIELCKKPKLEVIFLGGTIAKESQIASGGQAIHNLSKINADYGFIGTGYVDANYGLTEFDWESVQVKNAVIQASKSTVLLTISEKLNSRNRYKTCEMSDITTMITELEPTANILEDFRNTGVHLV
ncbi:MAG: DeoR/GlpR family DNA-binding transcription regulator [Allomuricauda sp.]|uniref:DeoR/GlpR transcriptional regulator n=1 Tax=Flagellimonas oceani TaxID=2698672 RepID=A0A6G7J7V3_9FLAO|nr:MULTISPECIES: DeoR/GlpR family DNA-binding transcription regulator [Allomuricauda]MBW8241853.1 DeoR/GlpR family DNA-binding transcription regulator [Allomuricauda oceani]QII46770.1 DeoR/GlpR transcriptional regulator [Allomuricauda oceani]|tara:strand:+ start:379 stop:1128 length:750 start_codon:yes stop_codon:yes gene_type:complete